MPNSGIYVFGFDDILTNTSYELYLKIMENWGQFEKYFKYTELLPEQEVQNRPVYEMHEWMIRPDILKAPTSIYVGKQLEAMARISASFYSQDIYKEMMPSKFARETLCNKMFIDSDRVDKVYILTRNRSDKQRESKERFIEQYFKHPKIETIMVGASENKGTVLHNKNIVFNAILQEQLPDIRDIAESYKDLEKKEFIVPDFGFCQLPKDLKFLITQRGGIVVEAKLNEKVAL